MHYFDRRGRRISRAVWARLYDNPTYAYVQSDAVTVGARIADVHTFWVGVTGGVFNPQDVTETPVLFRTVVARARTPDLVWAWPTEATALLGHRAVCAWLAGRGPMPVGLVRGSNRRVRVIASRPDRRTKPRRQPE